MSSTSDKLSGAANKTVGKVTGKDRVEAKGEAQETKGHLKDKLHNIGDAISNKIDKTAEK